MRRYGVSSADYSVSSFLLTDDLEFCIDLTMFIVDDRQ